MDDSFDDGLSAEEMAFWLGFADYMTAEERQRYRDLQNQESPIPDDSEPEWYEKD